MADPTPRRRRWFRFRLRTLLIVVAVIAVPVAWIANERWHSRHEHQVADELKALGFENIGLQGPYSSLELVTQQKPQGWWRELARFVLGDRIILISGAPNVKDLSPLTELKRLQWLDLHGSQVSDLSPLARFKNLRVLYLSDSAISKQQIGGNKRGQNGSVENVSLA